MSQIEITKGKLLKDSVEEWRDIEGYEGMYQVSNLGRVKTLARVKGWGMLGQVSSKEKILATLTFKHGYNFVKLYKDGKSLQKTIHRLVGNAFISNPDNKPQINHINGIRSDNRVENLEWNTNAENNLHAYRVLGRKAGMLGKKSSKSKPVYVTYIRTGKTVRFSSLVLACEVTKSESGHASSVCTGKRKSHNGLHFKYAS